MAANRSVKALHHGTFQPATPLSVILPIILVLMVPYAASAGVGVIRGISGEVYFKAKGQAGWEAAARGASVDVGDTVKTGSSGRTLLEFTDGTRLSLGNDSELRVARYHLKPKKRRAIFSLSTGKLRAVVKAFSGKTDIKVRTPTSVSGVKGTDFIVMNRGRANVIFAKAGAVHVAGRSEDGVFVRPGTMTENTEGADPIEPVEVMAGSSLEEVRIRLEAVTDLNAPVEWEEAGKLPEILARWNINYGHFLSDSRSFSDALEVLLIAIDLTGKPSTRAEAHIERGTLYSRNLEEPRRALMEYNVVIEEYPVEPFLENAVFSTGMIYMDLGKKRRALKFFRRYLEDYPGGAHVGTIEILLRDLEQD